MPDPPIGLLSVMLPSAAFFNSVGRCSHILNTTLIQLLEIDSFVILLQNLFVGRPVQRHTVRPDLAHADSVSPTAAIKADTQHIALRISFDIEREQTVPQAEESPQAKRPNRPPTARTHDLGRNRPLRRAAPDDAHVLESTHVQRFECRFDLLPRLVDLP